MKIPVRFFYVNKDKFILKFTWKGKGTRKAKTIWKKNNKIGRITLPDV